MTEAQKEMESPPPCTGGIGVVGNSVRRTTTWRGTSDLASLRG